MDVSEEYDSSKAENTSGTSKPRGVAEIISARLQAQTWDILGMPNFLMTVHKDKCTICQLYAEHVVDASTGATVPIPHLWIANVFHSAWHWGKGIIPNLGR